MRESNLSTQPPCGTSNLRQDTQDGAAFSGAVLAKSADLGYVIAAWPALSESIRQAILSLVGAALKAKGNPEYSATAGSDSGATQGQ
jgi:hypothetical protein